MDSASPATPSCSADTAPFRAELLGADRLADLARDLGGRQRVAARRRPARLPAVVAAAGVELTAVYRRLAADARADRPVPPAAEWLLDNFYLIEEQVRLVRTDLPAGYAERLPQLADGAFAGCPRVFEAMVSLVAHSDSRVDRERLELFVDAYQQTAPLGIGELWALPIMLRAALVENLRRLAASVLAAHIGAADADRIADDVLAAVPSGDTAVAARVASLGDPGVARPDAFLARLAQRLTGADEAMVPLSAWLDAALAKRGESLTALTTSVHQAQAADQVSVAAAITTIRMITALEWRDFFERASLVERTLARDPAGVYPRMDFASRDRYRHAVEGLAERAEASEVEVAEAALAAAAQADDPADPARGHVGYHLISGGRFGFERSIGYRPRLRERLHRGPLALRGALYGGVIVLITGMVTVAAAALGTAAGAGLAASVVLGMLTLLPASDVALVVANRLTAWVWPPRRLPKLDAHEPVAPEHTTLVVYTALLTSPAAARHVIANLEIGYLANIDPHVGFAVLADLKGAAEQHSPADEAIVAEARRGIEALNARYARGAHRPFGLFVRGRSWNEADGTWMGWERKRGALAEFCRLLRGATDTSFVVAEPGSIAPGSVTFLITLDTDTVLPRDGARQLVSAIAHPLNRAVVDPRSRTVRRGYGLVQPRVGMSLTGSAGSPFAWLHSGVTGTDPYAGAVSDTYMDVFGEGSFTGKGIFEVDVFNAVLEDRFPENTLLSHDLLEGSYLRTALASDIEVLDDQPASYLSHCARLHRWVRGDWQTLPWLGRRVPTPHGAEPSPLTGLHRWKVVDNIRRSISAPAGVAFGIAGFVLAPHEAVAWLAFALGVFTFPFLFSAVDGLVFGRGAEGTGRNRGAVLEDLRRDALRTAFALAVLPHQAYLMTDAICRALWRMIVTRRDMLEWETAAESERRLGTTRLSAFVRRMWAAPAVAAVGAVAVGVTGGAATLAAAAPVLTAWLAAPVAAWAASRPTREAAPDLTTADHLLMRRTARKTWRFFETFVTPEDHHLAPDNYQEDPKDEVAHRTSPTNIGLQLISCVTAYDLGYLEVGALVGRVSRTLQTMAGMERFRGHFYNWYDTRTLQPLRPTYISTVDSGNLAGHLITLRQALLEAAQAPLLGPQLLDGLADTVRLALEELPADAGPTRRALEELLRRVSLETPPATLPAWRSLLEALDTLVGDDETPAVTPVAEAIAGALRTLDALAPWVRHALADNGVAHTGALAPLLDGVPSLTTLAEGVGPVVAALEARPGADDRLDLLAGDCKAGARRATTLLAELRLAAGMAQEMWEHTDFGMLYDRERGLFSIGFNTAEGRLDQSYYDMLASECRLASFLAIARGDVPQEHWFRLGRTVTRTAAGPALVSWSASMFEYLMPLLVMRSWPGTLLDRTYASVVGRQMQYGTQRGVPWGVSESAFNAKDVELTYQYQAFGVPGLGLKRGLADDVVIAPYATVLALPVAPRAALDNLAAIAREGGEGRYGFYEAIDYTPGRVPAGTRRAVVKAYMAHHQGMSLVALGNMLTGSRMQERFHADPLVASAELLLQERVPRRVQTAQPRVEEVEFVRSVRETPPPRARAYPLADTPVPATHFLSNGTYSVMVTNAGGGYSRWRDRTVTRYREDITRDCWGTFLYLRDVESGRVWSAAHQPTLTPADDYHVTFSADKAEYRRIDGDIETHTEVIVSPEDDVEVRRVTITNRGATTRTLDVTSYLEVTLAPVGADHAHKAYSNLFVETEAVEAHHALLFTRRPRSDEEPRLWGVHLLACDSRERCSWSFETDRAAFLGRLRTPLDPRALEPGATLSGTVGAVLDPVCAIRQPVVVPAGGAVHLAFVTGAADSREAALGIAERYHDIGNAQRAADLAWSTAQIELRDLGITPEESVTFLRLASRLLLTDPHSRLKSYTAEENRLPISGLWGIGISGDHPILLAKIDRLEETPLVRQLLLAHQYWRSKGFVCDLVVLNTQPSAYSSALDGKLRTLLRTGHALQLADRPGGVHLRTADHIDPAVRTLLESVARVAVTGDGGPIALQLDLRARHPEPPDPHVPTREPEPWPSAPSERPALVFDNGLGGFDAGRDEYVIVLRDGATTPAPWANVIATASFGTLVSEAGIGCTWAGNSHENRITTWNNDPVSDGTGECLYIRDEETGEYWSPTPLPVRSDGTYVVRHGRGYSRFEHTGHGIAHTLDWFVATDEPVRLARLRLTNTGGRMRTLSVTQFVEWSLGDSRSKAQQRVVTGWDAEHEILTAHSWFNPDFPGLPAFLACNGPVHSFTANRTEFIGRNGTPTRPAALGRRGLGGETGRFHDNCGAVMRVVEIAPGETAEVTFLLGQTPTADEARALVSRFRRDGAAAEALEAARAYWRDILDTVQVETPDPALDLMVNGGALYQSLACRFWGRTAVYQSSGAFGFRDQLQDCLALIDIRPGLVREHLVEAARRQFPEGDVLHWWQPLSGRGVRTRFMDDRHWLPLVTAAYVGATGDLGVLDVETPYLDGPPVPDDREDLYLQPKESARSATLYEHCLAALALAPAGPHGLPLMGGGDWNDGMNRVGIGGSGESVWLAWFLDVVMRAFADVCDGRGDAETARALRERAAGFVRAAEQHAWDGAWYRRAYFDDGTPLGSASADECRIDAIAQAWAVLSGGGSHERARRAMESVEAHLVRWDDGLVALLAPPFDRMAHDPGYIKGYVPGVRENGGQYTHAAIWVALAYARLGDGDEAVSLLDLINPVNHALDAGSVARYKVEPYVIPADVYGRAPHVGRGGWTWYTGSAAWYHRVALREVLGLRITARDGVRYLEVDPCIPKDWPAYRMTYRFGGSTYHITVENPRGVNGGVARVTLDGQQLAEPRVPLADDGADHQVTVALLGG